MEQVDDFYFSALSDADELFPISDEKYADELQLQEVLISSAIATLNHYGLPSKKIEIERGESSSIIKSETFCKICMEAAPTSAMFFNAKCSHAFCRDCLSRYIITKIKENISAVKCPEEECKALLEPEHCQDIIPKEVFDRWGSALCESMILGSKNFSYCPFKDCSVLMLGNEGEERVSESLTEKKKKKKKERVSESECPCCRRLFCAKCEVAWHSGVSCVEFQRLGVDERGKEDLKLVKIAKRKKWMRCPQCKFYVEKTQGCLHVTCRCRYEFCYGCGKKWGDTHASCGSA